MSCPELEVAAGQLTSVRLRNYILKRGTGIMKGWSHRYVVISANFLYMYMNDKDVKPRRIVGLDGSNVSEAPEPIARKQPNAFKLATRTGAELFFSCETKEESEKWMTAIRSAPYDIMARQVLGVEARLRELQDVLVDDSKADDGAAAPSSPSKRPVDMKAILSAAQAAKELRRTHAKSSRRLAGQPSTMGDTEASVRKLEDDIAALRQQLASTEREKQQFKEDLALLRASKDRERDTKRMEANRADTEEVMQLRDQLRTAELRLTDRTSELDDLRRRMAIVQDQHDKEKTRLQDRVTALESQVQRAEIVITQLRADLAAAQAAARAGPASSSSAISALPHSSQTPMKSTRSFVASTAPAVGGSTAGSVSGTEGQKAEWLPYYKEAQTLEKAGRLQEAEQQYQVVLDICCDSSEGKETVAVATARRDLGRVLALQKKFDRAEEQYKVAVDLCSRLLGEAHPNTACALTDLAAVQREQSKFEDAEVNASRAVSSLRRGVGSKDVSTATALYNLAGLAKRQGKLEMAEACYAEALDIFLEKLGDSEGETADTMYQMGCLYRKRDEYSKAADSFKRAASAYSKAYGATDRRVEEARKRAKLMNDKLGIADDTPAPAGGIRPSGSRIAVK